MERKIGVENLKNKQKEPGDMSPAQTSYGISIALKMDYDQVVDQTVAALKEQGFGVLTEIDVQATLKKKLGIDFRRYVILGACNPPLAHRALSLEQQVGLLLPCNVIVFENDDGTSTVSALNPMAAMTVAGNPALVEVAEAATAKLTAAMDGLRQLAPAA
jgi:uncharacterized protein (DUF302 family)